MSRNLCATSLPSRITAIVPGASTTNKSFPLPGASSTYRGRLKSPTLERLRAALAEADAVNAQMMQAAMATARALRRENRVPLMS